MKIRRYKVKRIKGDNKIRRKRQKYSNYPNIRITKQHERENVSLR